MTPPEWPLWSSEHPDQSVPPAGSASCPSCGHPVSGDAAFCEDCGATLTPLYPPPPPTPVTEGSAQTHRLGSRNSQVTTCACGGSIDADGYCQVCGAKAPSVRDHFSQAPAEWVGGVCDRGVHHPRNEDAMALWAQEDRAVLVVCDGVSSSSDADVAATAAAEAGCAALVERVDDFEPQPDFAAAAQGANQAVIAATAEEPVNAPSATLAAAVLIGDQLSYANLGDTRVYLLGAQSRTLLSVDDSMAQAFIEQGMPREEAEALPRAHAITKWLGRDATDVAPRVGRCTITEPSWIVVCSDGLWNYASHPQQLAAQITATGEHDPVAIANKLVAWANAQGGQDNITVALAKWPPRAQVSLEHAESSAPEVEEHAENG